MLRLHFPASNNVAEYEALVNGLRIAIELGVRRLDARGDSQLVIDQVMKNSHCRDPKMEAYCDEIRRLEDKFYGLVVPSSDVVELEPVELVLQAPNLIAVGFPLRVAAMGVLHDLVDDKL